MSGALDWMGRREALPKNLKKRLASEEEAPLVCRRLPGHIPERSAKAC